MITDLAKYFELYDVQNFSKKRLGRDYDGGYVIIDNISNTNKLYSFGISDDCSFELDFLKNTNCETAYLHDFSIERLPSEHSLFKFVKRGISHENTGQFNTLEHFIEQNGDSDNNKLFLKMDVEGAEWKMLIQTPKEKLELFEQIVFELHWLESDRDATLSEKIEAMKKLTDSFYIVHAHANNYGFVANFNGFRIPTVLEITCVRKDLYKVIPTESSFPHKFDMPNCAGRPEIELNFYPFKPYYISMTSIPSRFEKLNEVVDSLLNQACKPRKIYIHIPRYYSRFDTTVETLPNISNDLVVINRCEDYGSSTKLVPILDIKEISDDAQIVIVDDDNVYSERMSLLLLDLSYMFPNSASCLFGATNAQYFYDKTWGLSFNSYNMYPVGLRGKHTGFIDVLEGFAGYCVKKRFFNDRVRTCPIPEIRYSDDLWISANIINNGYSISVGSSLYNIDIKFIQTDIDALNNINDKKRNEKSVISFLRETYKLFLPYTIQLYGDSHSSFLFRNIRHHYTDFSQSGITMHRIGRDNKIINFEESHQSPYSVFIFVYGEIDCRIHIHKQKQLGRDEDEIINKLVDNYLNTIAGCITVFHSIIVSCVPPPISKYMTRIQNHSELPLGSDADRIRYTKKMNKALKTKCAEKNFFFLDFYDYYSDGIGCLKYDLSDTNCHIDKNSKVLEVLNDLL